MSITSLTVEQQIRARLVTAEEWATEIIAVLRYDTGDPLAVTFVFPAEVSLDGRPVTWSFSRELLDAGLRASVGDGDVHLWPCGRAQTVLELHSPQGVAVIQFDSSRLRRFLRRSYTAVPSGGEDLGPDVERGLANLFGTV
ncbi:SsgA family sporulation/cell division regulator [Streptomyces sp. NPDC001941]|uniref:SsgA family sporulation/cell division regulator n=1 Tax=Streptomyces sp. NPDC001941 TaxID=3154659 RepID=UPI00332993DB